MSLSPVPRPTVNFFTSALLLFSGSFGGTHLTALVAPYSQLSGLVGFLMFPVAFIAGMQLWPWTGSLIENCRSIFTRAKKIRKTTPGRFQQVISSFAFVLTSIATSLLAGIILTPPAMQSVVDPGYRILIPAGVIYGVVCWSLIQLGYLQHADIYPKD
ncbi:MAG: hypothetical protein AAGA46_04055 [Cyanobacteria bacterium P01_F01_bin.13]